MLNTQTLEWLMACERLKDQMSLIESEGTNILGCFDSLERAPTMEERDARREAYLDNRARLQSLTDQYRALTDAIEAHFSGAVN